MARTWLLTTGIYASLHGAVRLLKQQHATLDALILACLHKVPSCLLVLAPLVLPFPTSCFLSPVLLRLVSLLGSAAARVVTKAKQAMAFSRPFLWGCWLHAQALYCAMQTCILPRRCTSSIFVTAVSTCMRV